MGAAAGPTGHDGFALGNDVLDRQVNVGESSAVESCSLPFTLGTMPKIGRRRVMMGVVGGKELIRKRLIALVPKFFNETTDDSFVIFRHFVFSSLRKAKTVLACGESSSNVVGWNRCGLARAVLCVGE